MTLILVIGFIAITLLLGWLALAAFSIALCCIGGFDEVNIPVGLVFLVLGIIPCAAWWFVVGSHINLSFS